MQQRPEIIELNRSHSWWDRLLVAGLGSHPFSMDRFEDSGPFENHGARGSDYASYTAPTWSYNGGRYCIELTRDTGIPFYFPFRRQLDACTVSFWSRVDSFNDYEWFWGLGQYGPGGPNLRISHTGTNLRLVQGSNLLYNASDPNFKDGNWRHYAITAYTSGTSTVWQFFRNGVSLGSGTNTATPLGIPWDEYMVFGEFALPGDSEVTGAFTDMLLWGNRILPERELWELSRWENVDLSGLIANMPVHRRRVSAPLAAGNPYYAYAQQ